MQTIHTSSPQKLCQRIKTLAFLPNYNYYTLGNSTHKIQKVISNGFAHRQLAMYAHHANTDWQEGKMRHLISMAGIALLLCCLTSLALAQLSGEYDVGGGNNDFVDPMSAAIALVASGISGPVTFNIYNGSYYGQVDLPGTIAGMGESNPITFRNAPGQDSVVITSPAYGFNLTGADYVTIQGLIITDYGNYGIYNNYSGTDSSKYNRFIGNYIYNEAVAGKYGIYLKYGYECQIIGNRIQGNYYGIHDYYGTRLLFANNMIYDAGYHGIREYFGTDIYFYYNSIYTTSFLGTGTRAALYLGYCTGATLRNNIFYQGATGGPTTAKYAIILTPYPMYTTVSDYNLFYAPFVNVGLYGLSQNTLADWQSASGLDMHSVSADPDFVSLSAPFDLHLQETSPAIGAGVPVAIVTDDIDGNPRDPVMPDIGADEYAVIGLPGEVDDLIITLSSSTDDSTNITLIWSPTENAQQYHIYKSLEAYSGFTLFASTTDTTFTDTNVLIGGSKSFYYVMADNESRDLSNP
jgi:parallel beta-helix repeat protein